MIPIRTDRRLHYTPWVNLSIVIVTVFVFLLQLQAQLRAGPGVPLWWQPYLLDPQNLQWYQFFSYTFLHQGWEHLLFNMVFLYVFGNSLEDRFGPIGYLCFYLAGGVVAGLGHTLVENSPVLGASGAISAVTGAYLALFPLSRITMVVWIIIVYTFEVDSIWIILLSLGHDVFFQFLVPNAPGVGKVAYLAHISGNVFGFAVGMILLATRVLPREPYDFLALVDRWNRRRQFRAMTRASGSPWVGDTGRGAEPSPITPHDQEVMTLRAEILAAMQAEKPGEAMDLYQRLLDLSGDQVMPRQSQLELANHAMNDGRYALAAQAYELFLRVYPDDELANQLSLILGMIYARYLNDPVRARALLTAASQKLDGQHRQLAGEILGELG
jgi:membrane associated rhomboid family serine protease